MNSLSEIDHAISTRALVRISERNGYDKGVIGIAMGYRPTYGNMKIGFIDVEGNYTGDYTVVAAQHVELAPVADDPVPALSVVPSDCGSCGGTGVCAACADADSYACSVCFCTGECPACDGPEYGGVAVEAVDALTSSRA